MMEYIAALCGPPNVMLAYDHFCKYIMDMDATLNAQSMLDYVTKSIADSPQTLRYWTPIARWQDMSLS